MRVAGIMSGTSLDGIDVAIVDIGAAHRDASAFQLHALPGSQSARRMLGVSNCDTHTREISRLNFLLGELYAQRRAACRSAATDRSS